MVGLGVLLRLISPVDLARALAGAQPGWLAVGLVLLSTSTLTGTLGFGTVLAARGIKVPFRSILAADLAGHFYALTLPLGLATGGAMRVLRLAGPGTPATTVAGAVLVNRLLDILASALLALAALPFLASRLAAPALWLLLVGGLGMAAALALVAACSQMLRRRLALAVGRGLPMPRRWRAGLRHRLLRLGRAPASSLRAQLPTLACALARHLQGGLGVLALAWAMQVDVGYAAALWVRTVTNFAMLLPLSIAGLGVREASFVALLTPLGIASATALAMALIVLGYQLLLALLGAVLELGSGMEGLRRVSPADRVP